MLKTLLFSLLVAFGFLSFSSTTNAEGFENESEFSYDVKSPNGPNNWGDINPEWSICNKGKMQSPIDLINKKAVVVSTTGELRMVYKPAKSFLINHNHAVELRWEGDAGYIQINRTEYFLRQCHWHTPSEHTIDGKRFNLEVHLIHKSKNNRNAVIGIVYEIGQPDSFLTMLSEHIKSMADKTETVCWGDPRQIEITTSQYFRYVGSLTTPRCTQDVVWTVFKQVQTLSNRQVRLLHGVFADEYKNNARPVMPFNSRDLLLYMKED